MQKKKKINLEDLENLICEEKRELNNLEHSVFNIKKELLDRTPTKFGFRDIARSFFGALIISFGFVLKGAMVRTAVRMTEVHLFFIIFVSIIILILEVYYFGYRKIKDKHERKIFQFIAKRVPTFYLISLLVSTGIVFIYGVNNDILVNEGMDVFKIIIAVSFPASLGAGFSDLLKKY